jgi:hypothetical protein
MPAFKDNKNQLNQLVMNDVENGSDASCTMVLLKSCVMHDGFVGTFNIFELRGGRGCHKGTPAIACEPAI